MNEEKISIEHNTVQETLVIPLFSRKLCTELYPDYFTDKKAVRLMERLDYDFSHVEEISKRWFARFGALEVGARQKAFALEAVNYLKDHPNASVVNLGCGLDQTAESCDNGTCQIYNLDFPDIIDVRSQLLPPGERVHHIACDMNDTSWFRQVERENGVVFLASGVFYYFAAQQIEALFNAMAAYFRDGILVFDTAGKKAVQIMVKRCVQQAGIRDVTPSFYVNSIQEDIAPWLRHATASSRPYMTGYFPLTEPSISGFSRLAARAADRFMKMKIVKIEFHGA